MDFKQMEFGDKVYKAKDEEARQKLGGIEEGYVRTGRREGAETGSCATAEGAETEAGGNYSHAEGQCSFAAGTAAHAEGACNYAGGNSGCHAEGIGSIAAPCGEYIELASYSGNVLTVVEALPSGIAAGMKIYVFNWNNFSQFTIATITNVDVENKTITIDKTISAGFAVKNAMIPEIRDDVTPYPAHAEGCMTVAVGNNSHTEGFKSFAVGNHSHAEGDSAVASGSCSHVEGCDTEAAGKAAHAEGQNTISKGTGSHSEGCNTNAEGAHAHAEGYNTNALSSCDHSEGHSTKANGGNAHAEGNGGTASGSASHAEGGGCVASGTFSHAEGWNTKAQADASHAEGKDCSATVIASHAEGGGSIAEAQYAHAEGYACRASAVASHSGGYATAAQNSCSYAIGHYNAAMTTGGTAANTAGHAFVIGGGVDENTRANAFSVMFNGVTKAKNTITASTNADYAEFFEWLDGNPDNEDRVGRFVTLEGEKIRIASESDDYILGIVSGAPFVLGNGDCDVWNGMHLRDEFTRFVMEPAPLMETVYVFEDGYESTSTEREPEYEYIPAENPGIPEISDGTAERDQENETAGTEETGSGDKPEQEYIKVPKPLPAVVRTYEREVKDENGNTVYEGTRPKLNPDYDPSQPYISRLDRPEWAPVGMLGVLSVVQDGTLEADGYCMCGENGIATKCDIPGCGYRVIRIINDNVARVVYRDTQPVSIGKKLQKLLESAE